MKKSDPDDWSPFWRNSSITSLGDLFPENYDAEVLDFWREHLAGSPDHVVDLACGNGALTWICNSILNSAGNRTRITGVDFADIAPFKALKRKSADYPDIEFIGNTRIEQLPFPDGSVDLFISQFGLEYSDLLVTVPELGRKLSASGSVAFILHDQDSVIVKGATEHMQDFRIVLDKIRLHDLALELHSLHQKFDTPAQMQASPAFSSLMSRIKHSADAVDSIARHQPANSPLHLYVRRLNSAFGPLTKQRALDRQELITGARDSFAAHVKRIEELAAAALSGPGHERLISLLETEGMTITRNYKLAYRDVGNIGIAISARR